MYSSNAEVLGYQIYGSKLSKIEIGNQLVINTINAYSYCESQKDAEFKNALLASTILLPDGIAIVLAAKLLNKQTIKKIAGADIHQYLLSQANANNQKVFYLGASESTLQLISEKLQQEFPNITVASYSPPYKTVFSEEDNEIMLRQINAFQPNVLFVGMTAPKQEKWVHNHKSNINVTTIVAIGAVFDFYAGTVKRAPKWMIGAGLEWLYRLVKEPKRMWRRYLIGNTKFCWYVAVEKYNLLLKK